MLGVALPILFWLLRLAVLIGALAAGTLMARRMPTRRAVGIGVGVFLLLGFVDYRIELSLKDWYCRSGANSANCHILVDSD